MWTYLIPLAVNFVANLISSKSLSNKFDIWWNVPSFMCHKHGFNFSEITNYGIIQNEDDKFLGDRIAILYDPGFFPSLDASGKGQIRNGGLPQEGDLELHLSKFMDSVAASIPEKNFSGLAIIDFEDWRPIWRQNWASLSIYKRESVAIEKKNHPTWSESELEEMAKKRFEKAGYLFFERTLEVAKKARPFAKWGFYGFPGCYNNKPMGNQMNCADDVKKDNDRMTWLYETSTALYPSIYIYKNTIGDSKRGKFIEGRVTEALRVAKLASYPLPVIPYTTMKYPDSASYYSKVDLESSVRLPRKLGTRGLIIWGSSKDTSSAEKCTKLNDYATDVLRPMIKTEKGVSSKHDFFRNVNTDKDLMGSEDSIRIIKKKKYTPKRGNRRV